MPESHELQVTRNKALRGVPGAAERLARLLRSPKHTNNLLPPPRDFTHNVVVSKKVGISRWESRWVDNSF